MSKSYIHKGALKQMLSTGVYATYYFFFKQQRLEQNDFFCANPDLDLAREIWNLLESKYIKKAFSKILPNIKINNKIYIPFVDTMVTNENVNSLPSYNYKDKHKVFKTVNSQSSPYKY